MNRKHGISITLVFILLFCTIIISSLEASRYIPSFGDSWDSASVVLVGEVDWPNPRKLSEGPRKIGTYLVDTKECFKGAEHFKKTLLFEAVMLRLSPSLLVSEDKTYLLFLKDKSVNH